MENRQPMGEPEFQAAPPAPRQPYINLASMPEDPHKKEKANQCDKLGDFFIITDQLTPSGTQMALWSRKDGDWFGKPQRRFYKAADVTWTDSDDGKVNSVRVWKRVL